MLKKIIYLIAMITILVLGTSTISLAGLEIKEGTTTYTNVNISESFDICYNLRNGNSTLGNTTLDPHLATSLDWGAVAYLAQSRYGANASTLSQNTTGNKTGVMDLSGYTQTATIFESRNTTSSNATAYRKRLEEALKDVNLKKYVDVISNTVNEETTRGRAFAETPGWYGGSYSFSNSTNTDAPIIIRNSVFGVINYGFNNNGQAATNVTFRPVIWN